MEAVHELLYVENYVEIHYKICAWAPYTVSRKPVCGRAWVYPSSQAKYPAQLTSLLQAFGGWGEEICALRHLGEL